MTHLGFLPGSNYCEALGINERGQVCGYVNNTQTGPWRAYIWENGQMHSLNIPTPYSRAFAINDLGQITGGMGTGSVSTAFLWDNGNITNLGALPDGGFLTTGTAINNLGDVAGNSVGHYPASDPDYAWHAFMWSKGAMLDLGVLPGDTDSRATGINDAGQVVGYSHGFGIRGFISQNGAMSALEDLVPPDPQIHVDYVYAINDHGQIAGTGYAGGPDQVALRLTPIPATIGDTNCDQLVNLTDLTNVIQTWGERPARVPFEGSPDVNADGVVTIDDLVMVISNWTSTLPSR